MKELAERRTTKDLDISLLGKAVSIGLLVSGSYYKLGFSSQLKSIVIPYGKLSKDVVFGEDHSKEVESMALN